MNCMIRFVLLVSEYNLPLRPSNKKTEPLDRSSAFSFRKLPIRQVNNFFLSDLIEIIFSCLFGRN